MNNSIIKIGAAAALAVGFIVQNMLPAAAGEVQNRLDNQQARIHQGVRNGTISHREARHDERRLEAIRRERNRNVSRHGYLTGREDARINHQLNHTSTNIHQQRAY